jgi:hypothetical protein
MDYFDTSYSKKKSHKKLKKNTKKILYKGLSGSRSKARGYYFPKKKSKAIFRSKKNYGINFHKKKIYVGGIF